MTNQILDANDRDPSREPDSLPAGTYVIGRAEARVLWAVRVLDAWVGEQNRQRFVATGGGYYESEAFDVSLVHGQYVYRRFGGETLEAARLAAADAIWPTLDEATRAKIGARP